MKKIIRTNNLQKALEDYDALKGQAVSYVSVLPLPPNVRNGVYCKQSTTNIEESMVLTVDRLIENYAQETETANHFVIPETYTITYSGDVVKGIEVSDDVAIMYEDEEFTTALATTFNLEDNYIFDVITHVTEMAYYVGDAVNQVLHPVVSFGVIAEVHAKIDRVERELDAKIDSNYNTLDNKIDNNYNTLDNKIDNSYNTLDTKIDNEISNLAVNFTTDNLVANVATVNNANVTNANVTNAVVGSLNVAEIIANGSAGTNGQILGKVNGNLEWQDFSTDNFVVNNITVNKNAVADNASVNNLSVANNAVVNNANVNVLTTSELNTNDIVVNNSAVIDNVIANNAYSIKNVNSQVVYVSKNDWDTRGWNATSIKKPQFLRDIYDLGPIDKKNTVDNYQFLPSILISEQNYYSYFNDFYVYNVDDELFVGAKRTTAPLLSLIVTGPRGNTYLMGKQFLSPNFPITSVDNILVNGEEAGTTASTTVSLTFTNSAVTNSFNTSKNTLFGATSVLGTFMVYSNYDTNMPCGLRMNDATGITTNVMNTHFSGRDLFYNRWSMTDCFLTNTSLIINAPSGYNVFEGVTSLFSTFYNCTNFNQPVTIPDGVTSLSSTFYNCTNFNQPVTIPKSVENMYHSFYKCTALASSSVPIHISHEITLGDTSNYIYNMLVNGGCGITFAANRILNDA